MIGSKSGFRWRGMGFLAALAALLLTVAACGSDPTATPTPTSAPVDDHDDDHDDDHGDGLAYDAGTAAISIDGVIADWAGVEHLAVPMQSLDTTRSVEVELQVAVSGEDLAVLVTIPDDYNATPGDHSGSGSFAVLWAIGDHDGVHMGTDGKDYGTSLGMVDIWHWEIDCEPGVVSGGINRSEDGDDPACNLDDEYALTPFERFDDDGDNLLKGVYDHSGRALGEDAAGDWYWELKRPLTTSDVQDAQFASGATALVALAYWDADETADGWTDSGHLQSSDFGWIEVTLP